MMAGSAHGCSLALAVNLWPDRGDPSRGGKGKVDRRVSLLFYPLEPFRWSCSKAYVCLCMYVCMYERERTNI